MTQRENVKAVLEQADDMMVALTAVRGERFAQLVKIMLISLTASQIFKVTLDAGQLSDTAGKRLMNVHVDVLARILEEVAVLNDVPQEIMTDALQEADRINSVVTALMERAVTTANFG